MNEAIGQTPDRGGIPDIKTTGDAQEAAISGIELVKQFAGREARRSEARHGPFPRTCDHDDVIQTANRILCESSGLESDLEQIYDQIAEAFIGGNFYASAEFAKLKRACRQAVNECRQTEDKRKQRGLPQQEPLADHDPPTPDASNRTALLISLKDELSKFSPEQQQVLNLRREGYKFKEIAQITGQANRQAANKIARGVIKKLARCLSDSNH